MKKPQNWENVQAARERVPLPAGAYLIKIIDAKQEDVTAKDDPGTVLFSVLKIGLDITEGEFAGYYQNDYSAQQKEDKRWKGVLRQYLPKDDGTEKDGWTASALKALVEAVEESNPGFHFDWDEKKLKGKVAGCLFRSEEWAFDGRTGWTTRPLKLISVETLRSGKYRLPKEKPLPENKRPVSIDIAPDNQDFTPVSADDEDLPF